MRPALKPRTTKTNNDLHTQTSGCWQHSDKSTYQTSTKCYVRRVFSNKFYILPLVEDDSTCTTNDNTPTKNETYREQPSSHTKLITNTTRKQQQQPDNPQPTHKLKTNIRLLSATLQLDRRNKMLYVPAIP